MEKRLALAIALSLIFFLGWSSIMSKFYPVENKKVAKEEPTISATVPVPSTNIPGQAFLEKEEAKESLINFSQEKFDIVFDEPTASIKSAVFKEYSNHAFVLEKGFLLNEPGLFFKKASQGADFIEFKHSGPDKEIAKRFIFSNTSYGIELQISVRNLTDFSQQISTSLSLGILDFGGDQAEARLKDITVSTRDGVFYPNPRKSAKFENLIFLGIRDRYFCAIIQPDDNKHVTALDKLDSQRVKVSIEPEYNTFSANEVRNFTFRIYLGPQELDIINGFSRPWSQVVYFGKLDFIAKFLLSAMKFFENIFNNWGIAIIALSLLISIVLYPLTFMQMRTMKEMQQKTSALQPQIDALKEKYKENPKKLNEETQQLFHKHGVYNVRGCFGCLIPLLLQMPIFITFFQIFNRSILLKGAAFLWIKDLSGPDQLVTFPFTFPIPLLMIKISGFNLLPLLAAIAMFVQQKATSVAGAGSSQQQQKFMMYFTPVLFGLFFYNFSSGWLLYFLTSTSFSLVVNLIVKKPGHEK